MVFHFHVHSIIIRHMNLHLRAGYEVQSVCTKQLHNDNRQTLQSSAFNKHHFYRTSASAGVSKDNNNKVVRQATTQDPKEAEFLAKVKARRYEKVVNAMC